MNRDKDTLLDRPSESILDSKFDFIDDPKYYQGVSTPATPQENPQVDQEKGWVGATGSAVARGAIGIAEMGLGAMAGADRLFDRYVMAEPENDPDNFDLKKTFHGWRKDIEEGKNKMFKPVVGGAKGTWAQGVESFVTSAGIKIPAFVVGTMTGGVGNVAGGILGMVATSPAFGLSQYDEAVEKYTSEFVSHGHSPEKARKMAEIPSLLEGSFEVLSESISDLISGRLMGPGLSIGKKKIAEHTLGEILKVGLNKETVKHVGKIAFSETAGEFLNSIAQGSVEEVYGKGKDLSDVIQDPKFWDKMQDQLGPIVVSSILFGVVGTGTHAYRNKQISDALGNPLDENQLAKIGEDINNPLAPLDDRISAVNVVAEDLARESETLSKAWLESAMYAVRHNESIGMDETLGQFEPELTEEEIIGTKARDNVNTGSEPEEDQGDDTNDDEPLETAPEDLPVGSPDRPDASYIGDIGAEGNASPKDAMPQNTTQLEEHPALTNIYDALKNNATPDDLLDEADSIEDPDIRKTAVRLLAKAEGHPLIERIQEAISTGKDWTKVQEETESEENPDIKAIATRLLQDSEHPALTQLKEAVKQNADPADLMDQAAEIDDVDIRKEALRFLADPKLDKNPLSDDITPENSTNNASDEGQDVIKPLLDNETDENGKRRAGRRAINKRVAELVEAKDEAGHISNLSNVQRLQDRLNKENTDITDEERKQVEGIIEAEKKKAKDAGYEIGGPQVGDTFNESLNVRHKFVPSDVIEDNLKISNIISPAIMKDGKQIKPAEIEVISSLEKGSPEAIKRDIEEAERDIKSYRKSLDETTDPGFKKIYEKKIAKAEKSLAELITQQENANVQETTEENTEKGSKAEAGKEGEKNDVTVTDATKADVVVEEAANVADFTPKGLKTQKKSLLENIDDAIKHRNLKQIGKEPTLPENITTDDDGKTYTIDVPGDGTFKVLGSHLKDFRKKVSAKWPTGKSSKRSPAKKPAKMTKRVSDEDVGYTISYTRGGKSKLPRLKQTDGLITTPDGFSGNGHYMTTSEVKTSKNHSFKRATSEPLLDGISKPDTELTPTSITSKHGDNSVGVILEDSNGNKTTVNADYFDPLMKQFPEAKLMSGEDGVIHFVEDGKTVALLMPLSQDEVATEEAIKKDDTKRTPGEKVASVDGSGAKGDSREWADKEHSEGHIQFFTENGKKYELTRNEADGSIYVSDVSLPVGKTGTRKGNQYLSDAKGADAAIEKLLNRSKLKPSEVEARKKRGTNTHVVVYKGTMDEVYPGKRFQSKKEAEAFISDSLGKNDKAFDPMSLVDNVPSDKENTTTDSDVRTKDIRTKLENFKAELQNEIKDWQSREYKGNKTKITPGGDPDNLNVGSTSIGAANERRRSRNIEQRGEAINEIDDILSRVDNDPGAISALLDSTHAPAVKFAEKLIAELETGTESNTPTVQKDQYVKYKSSGARGGKSAWELVTASNDKGFTTDRVKSLIPHSEVTDIRTDSPEMGRGEVLMRDGEAVKNNKPNPQSPVKETDTGVALFTRAKKGLNGGQGKTKALKPMVALQVEKVINRLKLDNAPPVVVVQSEADLPAHLTDHIATQNAQGQVPALYDPKTGKVYIVADLTRNADDVQAHILHEVTGHFGLRGLLGDNLNPILDQVFDHYGEEALGKIARDYELDLSKESDRRIAAEEMLAFMQKEPNRSFAKKVYANIRKLLRKLGFIQKMNDTDIEQLLSEAYEFAQKGKPEGTPTWQKAVSNEAAFSLGKDAEYMRLAKDPEKNKGRSSKKSDDIRFSRKAKDAATSYGASAVLTKLDQAKAVLSPAFDKFMYWAVDKNRPIQQVQRRLKNMSESMDVFLRETQRPKVTADLVRRVYDEHVKPLLESIAKSGFEMSDVEEYAHAKHAQEANIGLRHANSKRYLDSLANLLEGDQKSQLKADMADIKSSDINHPEQYYELLEDVLPELVAIDGVAELKDQWDTFSEKPSGMTDQTAKDILNSYKDKSGLEKIRLQLAAINDLKLDILHNAGLLPTEEYGLIKNKYQFYVPLYREGFDSVPGVGKGVQPGGKMIKTRGGSTRAVVDIIGHSISNLETAIGRAEKARSVKALVSLVVHNPNPDFWSLKEVNKDPRYDSDGNLQMYPNPSDVRPNQLRVMVDGKQMLLEVNRDDATAMRMLKGLRNEDQASGLLVNTLSKVNRYLSTINTSLSPEFIVSNFIRDLQTAKINISDTAVTGKIVRNVPKAIKAIFATEQGKLTGDEWEQWYDRFRKAGGKIGWSDVHGSVANLSKKLEGELAMLQGKRPKMKTLKQVLNLIESTNTSVENGVRLAAFRAAVEQGMSEDRAGQLASDLTVDFTRKGAAGPAINALYLFANASIQGNYRMIRSLVKSKKTRKLVGKVAATAFIVALSNSMQGGDDDDWWVDYEDYVRERNMIIKIPGLDTALKIPMPWGYNVFWNLGTEAARMVTEKRYDLTKGVARTGLTIANSFNPLAAGTLLQTIAPTIADPFAMVAENKSWHGGPLMPEKSPYVKGDQPDSQRYWNSARGFSKSIAAGLNSATGGNPVRSGGIDVSPETIDMIIDQMGGSLLRFTSDIVSTPAKLLSGDDVQLKEVPFLRRVLSSKSEYAASQQYYNIVNEVATFKREMKQFRGTPEYEKLMKKRGRLKRFIIPLKNGERKLTRLRKIRDRRKDNGLDVKGVETKIRNEYESFNKFYNKVMGK